MAQIKDIAAKVGVSSTAVSKYLRNPDTTHVSAELKQKIEQAIAELNYRRNVLARSLSAKESRIISILIPFNGPVFQSTFVNELLSGLESVFAKTGYHIFFPITPGADSATMVKNQIEHGYGFDGFVLFATRFCTLDHINQNIEALAKTEFPFVVVNSPNLPNDVNQVIFTTPESSSAVKFLFDQGHTRIALLLGNPTTAMSIEELQQYREIHHKYGIELDERLIIYGDYERANAKGAMLEFLRKKIGCSAVYCVSDTMALGVYEAAQESGLRIPEDISVIGKHDSFFASFLNPPLTSVRVKIFEVGAKAADILVHAIQQGSPPKKVFLNNELILRGSTRVWR